LPSRNIRRPIELKNDKLTTGGVTGLSPIVTAGRGCTRLSRRDGSRGQRRGTRGVNPNLKAAKRVWGEKTSNTGFIGEVEGGFVSFTLFITLLLDVSFLKPEV